MIGSTDRPAEAPAAGDAERAVDETLFVSRDLLIRKVGGFSQARCVVTFDRFTDERTLDRQGFGEQFFRSRGVDAVHVICRDNDWYQYAETLSAMAHVRAATRAYPRVLTYGSSMGGYAAIRLSGLAGASCALAMSPQFSVLPGTAPWEYRWNAQSRRLRAVWEHDLPLPCLPEAYLLYDPLDLDGEHAALYAAAGLGATHVRLRGAGHQVASLLLEVGLLQDVVLGACDGPLDAATLEREAWRRRRGAPQHWVALAERARPSAWRIAAIRRALELAPGDPAVLGRLAGELGRAGRFAEALDAHRKALQIAPGHPPLLDGYVATLVASGDRAGAVALLQELSERTGEPAHAAQLELVRSGAGAAGGPGPVTGGAGGRENSAARRRRWLRPHRRRRPVVGRNPGGSSLGGAEPITTEPGQRGQALYGPYVELRPGAYVVTFTVAARPGLADGPPASGLLRLRRLLDHRTACVLNASIHAGRTVLATRKLSVAALMGSADGRFSLRFELPERTVCEFRVFATGAVGLVVQPSRPWRRVRERSQATFGPMAAGTETSTD